MKLTFRTKLFVISFGVFIALLTAFHAMSRAVFSQGATTTDAMAPTTSLMLSAVFGLIAAAFLSNVAVHLMRKTLSSLVSQTRSATRHEPPKSKVFSSEINAAVHNKATKILTEELEQAVQALASERDRFESVLEGMSDAVIALDTNHIITLVNPAALTILGRTNSPAGQHIGDVLNKAVLSALLENLKEEHFRVNEFELAGIPPRKVLARATLKPNDGTVILVLQDVTDLRRLETIRRDFVANVSHELRTPVSVIQANVETLLDGALDDKEYAPKFMQAIHRNADRLSRLIADLLDISRLEANKYELESRPLDLTKAIQASLDLVQARSAEKQISILTELPSGLYILADHRALDHVLTNLLDNAIKYLPPGGQIEIVATPYVQDIYLEVRDNGPGIAPEHHARIFERFYRVDKGRSSHMGGTGLGLSIVKHLVTAMGGQVGLKPASPTGSAFWFTLPSAHAAENAVEAITEDRQ